MRACLDDNQEDNSLRTRQLSEDEDEDEEDDLDLLGRGHEVERRGPIHLANDPPCVYPILRHHSDVHLAKLGGEVLLVLFWALKVQQL